MIGKAISITAKAFEDVKDKGGRPYIFHCLYVMNQMPENDVELQCIAVMHDLIEDTHYTISDLRLAGFSERILKGLELLTHDPSISYDNYIKSIALNEDAKKVKIADLRHNSDINRMKGLRKKDFDRLEKYHKAYAYLKD